MLSIRDWIKLIISELAEENKTVVSKLIDAFLFQQEMKQKLAQ